VVTAILGFGSIVAIMIFVWRALQSGATSAALLGGVIGVAGIWQLEPMIRLNRPAEFDPNDPPPALLPNT
jgi:hypothetical protein